MRSPRAGSSTGDTDAGQIGKLHFQAAYVMPTRLTRSEGEAALKRGPVEVEDVLCPEGTELPSARPSSRDGPRPGPAHSSEGPGCAR